MAFIFFRGLLCYRLITLTFPFVSSMNSYTDLFHVI